VILIQVENITRFFPAWSITEIKGLTVRERKYWNSRAMARAREAQQHG
jgi:hypothetical protein